MRIHVLTAALLIAGCAETQPAEEGPRDTAGWDADRATDVFTTDDELTAGAWQMAPDGWVEFAGSGGQALFRINCDLRGGLVFRRAGLVPRGRLAMMQLRTGSVARRLAVTDPETEEPVIEARTPYSDPLIPALMRFQGPLEVTSDGLMTFILPPSPIVREFVEQCGRISGRAPGVLPGPETDAEANQVTNESTAETENRQ